MRTAELTKQAMLSRPVRRALQRVAGQVAARADSIGARDNTPIAARVAQGIRPRGRPYAYVESTNVAQEYGDHKTARRRVLGRAARGAR